MNDTPREIAEMIRERLMSRSGAERLAMGSRMFDVARAMVLASLPAGLPEIDVKRRLCERLYGDEVKAEDFIQSLKARRPS